MFDYSVCKNTLFTNYNGYRLGDMTLPNTPYRNMKGGADYHIRTFPESLAAIYLRNYTYKSHLYNLKSGSVNCKKLCEEGKQTKRCHDCYVPSSLALKDIIMQKLNNITQLVERAIIHIRVGDVIEYSSLNIGEIIRKETRLHHGYWTFTDPFSSRRFVAPEKYILPLYKFYHAKQYLKKNGIKNITIISGSPYNMSSFAKSCDYLSIVGMYFEDEYNVDYMFSGEPDETFIYAVQHKFIITTGFSRFGNLMSNVGTLFGANVMKIV